MKYLTLLLAVWLSACSLIIETGTPIEEEDAEQPTLQVRDAFTGPTDEDASVRADADGLETSMISDGGINTDAGPLNDAMDSSISDEPDGSLQPECLADDDCGDGLACENELCVTPPCSGLCEDDQVCVSDCCQPRREATMQGACANPIPAILGFNPIDERRVADAETAAIGCLNTDEPGFTHSFFSFQPDASNTYCVQTETGTEDQGVLLTVVIRPNCCESDTEPLECIGGTLADPEPRTDFSASSTEPTIIHLYGPYRPNMGIDLSLGACACEATSECALGQACINQTCIDRLGHDCSEDPEYDCGRLGSCQMGICQAG